MLRARSDSRGYYVLPAAELLPFRSHVFDLVTAASALHWFERGAMEEVARVLESAGALVVYDVWFPAEMPDVPSFHGWATGEGLSRYRSVPRHHHDQDTLRAAGFEHVWSADLRRDVEMRQADLVEYLMTHSERIAAVQLGGRDRGGAALGSVRGHRALLRRCRDPRACLWHRRGRVPVDKDVKRHELTVKLYHRRSVAFRATRHQTDRARTCLARPPDGAKGSASS